MENNTKEMFLNIIPRVEKMIEKEESHIKNLLKKRDEYLLKQEKQNEKLFFKIFPFLKFDYTEMIEFIDSCAVQSFKSKLHFEMRLKEYKDYASKL